MQYDAEGQLLDVAPYPAIYEYAAQQRYEYDHPERMRAIHQLAREQMIQAKLRNRPSQCESVIGQLASGDEVCVCVAADALRKLRFSANFSDHKRASGSRLRARSARAGLDSCVRSSASEPRFGDEVCVVSARPGIHIVMALTKNAFPLFSSSSSLRSTKNQGPSPENFCAAMRPPAS